MLNRLDDALLTVRLAVERKLESEALLQTEYFVAFFYPVYVRGLAYLAARQPAEAAAEFQRIVDHPSIVLVDPMGALARLQLARALARSGDTAKAKNAYSDLLTVWKNADPDLPLLKQWRSEHLKLP
jgi:hypothetical protein